ncbi:MAG: hypothetical protein QMD61_08970 [Methanobacterium sp.]|nr:hypothetical protein [Methanobacterium sp.]
MKKYKVSSIEDNTHFLITRSYRELYKTFKGLKTRKGKIIHVIGAPGTGKSANIYYALENADLDVYDINFDLKDVNASSRQVFDALFETVAEDLNVKSKEEIYEKLSKYDAVLIADNFHDSHFFGEKPVGFSKWTDKKGFKTFYFYLLCIREYLKHRKEFKKINIIFQTAWRVYIRGEKYDIFSDFGPFSTFIKIILKIFFQGVEISYSQMETINIVKMHIENADEVIIKKYIQKYGLKPRFICNALENELGLLEQ